MDPQSVIQTVAVAIDSAPPASATYGMPLQDICAALRDGVNCPGAGWTYFVDTGLLANGVHTLNVTVTAADGQTSTRGTSFTIANWTTDSQIRMSIGAPAVNATVSGLAHFGGWALDDMTSLSGVALAVDGVPLGQATYGGIRTDVCNSLPNREGCPNVGWDYLLDTTQLADGNHNLAVTALAQNGINVSQSRAFSVE